MKTYKQEIICSNCGYKGVKEFPKGMRSAGLHECSNCGCRDAKAVGLPDSAIPDNTWKFKPDPGKIEDNKFYCDGLGGNTTIDPEFYKGSGTFTHEDGGSGCVRSGQAGSHGSIGEAGLITSGTGVSLAKEYPSTSDSIADGLENLKQDLLRVKKSLPNSLDRYF